MLKRTSSNNKTVLVYIGGIGFMFEVNQALKHNLISPDVLDFFDGVLESEDATEDCAFPMPISDTNIRHSIFQYIGEEWVICSDTMFRKCKKVKCTIEQNSITENIVFYIDRTLRWLKSVGVISMYFL